MIAQQVTFLASLLEDLYNMCVHVEMKGHLAELVLRIVSLLFVFLCVCVVGYHCVTLTGLELAL